MVTFFSLFEKPLLLFSHFSKIIIPTGFEVSSGDYFEFKGVLRTEIPGIEPEL
jgi:hypothetical protein